MEFQVGIYWLVNYEDELWPGQITKITSSSLIHVKCYKKATAPASSTCRRPKKTWWARLPYYGLKAQNEHTRCTCWIHQKSCCTNSWTIPCLGIAFSWTILFFSLGAFLEGFSLFQRHFSWGSSWWLLNQKSTNLYWFHV